jgi:hypothetical protein
MTLRFLTSRVPVLAFLLLLSARVPVASAQTAVPPPEQPPLPLEFRTDPVLAVASYYNAIALGEYDRAYSYWEDGPVDGSTLAEFSAGYVSTIRVAAFMAAPVFEGVAAGSSFAQVPVLVTAEHVDGARHNYAGCVTVHKANVPVGDATQPDPNWSLRDADISEVADFDLTLLDTVCEPPPDEALDVYTARNSPIEVLGAYINAITNQNYARAYSYWELPPDNATLEQFSAGYADTAAVSLVVRADAFTGGAAGSMYASIPVLLTATDFEGDKTFFGGCYVTRHSNVPVGDATAPTPEWWLYSADVTELEPTALQDPIALLDGACLLDAAG